MLLIDDHPTVLLGFKHLLASAGFEVAGEVGNAVEAVQPAGALRPDLVLTDLPLGEDYGTEVCREIKAQVPEASCVLVFTSGCHQAYPRYRPRLTLTRGERRGRHPMGKTSNEARLRSKEKEV